MDLLRMSIVVIVAYVLGLGTGVVGGVFFSFREFATPVAAAPATAPSPVADDTGGPRPMAVDTPYVDPTASPAVAASPDATPVAGSPAPSLPVAGSPEPSPVAGSPAASPDAPVAGSPGPVAVDTPAPDETPDEPSPTPDETPPAAPRPEKATLVVTSNKGEGFKVFVDGTMAGKTPVSVSVTAGKPHHVKVVGGDSYTSWEGKVTPNAGDKRKVEAAMSYIPPPPAYNPPPPAYVPPPPAYNPPPVYYPPANTGGGRPSVRGNQRF